MVRRDWADEEGDNVSDVDDEDLDHGRIEEEPLESTEEDAGDVDQQALFESEHDQMGYVNVGGLRGSENIQLAGDTNVQPQDASTSKAQAGGKAVRKRKR